MDKQKQDRFTTCFKNLWNNFLGFFPQVSGVYQCLGVTSKRQQTLNAEKVNFNQQTASKAQVFLCRLGFIVYQISRSTSTMLKAALRLIPASAKKQSSSSAQAINDWRIRPSVIKLLFFIKPCCCLPQTKKPFIISSSKYTTNLNLLCGTSFSVLIQLILRFFL